jgi:two-component system sensor kinase FixL
VTLTPSALDQSRRTQETTLGAMLAFALVVSALVWAGTIEARVPVTVGTLFAIGGVLTCIGLVAGTLERRRLLRIVSLALAVVSLASLYVLVIRPAPAMDPTLFAGGQWTRGPIPFGVGWSYLAMSVMMGATGIALLFAPSRNPLTALLAFTFARTSLWVGGYWQLAYIVLNARFTPLFEGAAGGVQFGLATCVAISACMLSRGDRGWMRTLTSADRSVSFAAFILPGALLPVLGTYLTGFGAKHQAFDPAVARLLSVEVTSASLMLVGAAVLRSLWLERRKRESLADALEQSAVIVHALDGVIEYWPRGCEALYGYSASEAVGRPAAELLRTEHPVPAEEIVQTLRDRGEWSGELRQYTRSGKPVWVAARVVLNERASGGGAKYVQTLTDITDLKRTHAELQDATDALSQAVTAYELGIVDHDAVTNWTRFSPVYEHMLGFPPGGLGHDRRASWEAILPPDKVAMLAAWQAEDIAAGAPSRTLTITIRRPDGEMRDIHGMARYHYSPEGRLLRLVGIYRDVTDQLRDRAEAAARGSRLIELQWELTHTSRLSAMGEMAAALAHELNQPLTAVGNSVGAISLILKDDGRPVDEKTRQRVLRAAAHAEAQAVRAGEIVRRLREFISRGESDTRAEDLRTLVDDAAALALPNANSAGVAVKKRIEPGASEVLADRIQIQQVLVNLVRNAVEAMREQTTPRRVDIAARAIDGMAVVSVCDTGGGVEPVLVETLFAPFRSSKRDGMGVGLSICRRIVEAHGGRMWFEPAPSGGACFKFTLPLIPSETRHDAP